MLAVRAFVERELDVPTLPRFEDDHRLAGWFDPTKTRWQDRNWEMPDGFVTALRNRATVEFTLFLPMDGLTLFFEARPLARIPRWVPAVLVVVNGFQFEPILLETRRDRHKLALPRPLLRRGTNLILFHYVQIVAGTEEIISYENRGPLVFKSVGVWSGNRWKGDSSPAAGHELDELSNVRVDAKGGLRIPAGHRVSFLLPVGPESVLALEEVTLLGMRDSRGEDWRATAQNVLRVSLELEDPPTTVLAFEGTPVATEHIELPAQAANPQYAVVTIEATAVGGVPLDFVARIGALRLQHPGQRQASWRGDPCVDCNVILISVDTLRADRLGVYGGKRDLTPGMDSFAADSIVFQRHIAHAPSTLHSHASMFTGLFPPGHGASRSRRLAVPDSIETLAEILRERGFTTAAFTAGGQLAPSWGLAQGFDIYESEEGDEAHECTGGALHRCAGRGRMAFDRLRPTSGPAFAT